MSDPSCVFCKIIAGDIPAMRVFEDESVLVFIDIHPVAEGHLLIVPKRHYRTLDEMSPEAVEEVTRHLPRLGRALARATAAGGYNLLQNNGRAAGQEVPHVHFHLIPRTAADGLGYRWRASTYTPGRAEHVQRQLIDALSA